MKLKRQIACAALLATAALPAWALQLGQIQVKSALNQPLVAAIPLHPKNLTELDGLTVGLAPAQDFARAGLQLTPTSQTLRFHVVSDNNGQKLILVTSSEPVTDPYLDFLVQVNTRDGKQIREFVVLLNPVIVAPAPEVQAAPVAAAPASGSAVQPELPPASAFAQPAPASAPPVAPPPQAAPAPAAAANQPATQAAARPASPPAPASAPPRQAWPMPGGSVAGHPAAQTSAAHPAAAAPLASPAPPPQAAPASAATPTDRLPVQRGDTLYHLASEAAQDSGTSVNQMMVAMLAANPDAFAQDNINNLKAGAILRIPTREEIDRTSLARANAEVRRQNETWSALKPKPATMVAGAAAEAAANAAPEPGAAAPSSAHLKLVPPSGSAGSGASRAGVTGGTSTDSVGGLKQQLQNDRSTLASLGQANADLESRVRSLKDIAGKSDKLLSLKDATVAELQRKLAEVQAGKGAAASAPAPTAATAAAPAHAVMAAGAPAASAPAASAAVASAAPKSSGKPRAVASPSGGAWLQRPLAWIIGGAIVVALILFGLLLRRRGHAGEPARGPLPDPDDIVRGTAAPLDDEEAMLHEDLADHPDDPARHLALCRHFYARGDVAGFVTAAEVMHAAGVDPDGVAWREVLVMGRQLAPHNPLFANLRAPVDDPYGIEALRRGAAAPVAEPAGATPVDAADDDATVMAPVAAVGPVARMARSGEPAIEAGPLDGDSVDTKLDLARAYIDMGDPAGARTMLEEVLREGSQMQQDEARRMLADVEG